MDNSVYIGINVNCTYILRNIIVYIIRQQKKTSVMMTCFEKTIFIGLKRETNFVGEKHDDLENLTRKFQNINMYINFTFTK